jgi:hypothetical protein
LCITAKLIVEWQRWVMSAIFAMSAARPLSAKADIRDWPPRAIRNLTHCSKQNPLFDIATVVLWLLMMTAYMSLI